MNLMNCDATYGFIMASFMTEEKCLLNNRKKYNQDEMKPELRSTFMSGSMLQNMHHTQYIFLINKTLQK